MSLSSLQLDAFLAVATVRSFSKASRSLRLTQSALSQRVLNLEEELGAAVFIREPSGARLTPLGEELLRYCQARLGLEEEFLARLRSPRDQELGGVIRIGGFSTVMRSAVLPALAPLLARHPGLGLEVFVRELRDLAGLLQRGEAEFVVHTEEPRRPGVVCVELGREEYVLVERAEGGSPDIYLDHDPEDATTLEFLRAQGGPGGKSGALRRRFLGDIYGILDGVRLGWGKAVVPRHLVAREDGLRIVSKAGHGLKVPVRLHYREQPFYPRLHSETVKALVKGALKPRTA